MPIKGKILPTGDPKFLSFSRHPKSDSQLQGKSAVVSLLIELTTSRRYQNILTSC